MSGLAFFDRNDISEFKRGSNFGWHENAFDDPDIDHGASRLPIYGSYEEMNGDAPLA